MPYFKMFDASSETAITSSSRSIRPNPRASARSRTAARAAKTCASVVIRTASVLRVCVIALPIEHVPGTPLHLYVDNHDGRVVMGAAVPLHDGSTRHRARKQPNLVARHPRRDPIRVHDEAAPHGGRTIESPHHPDL